MTPKFYSNILSQIHDQGFRDFSIKGTPFILKKLRKNISCGDKVVELGCGSGLLSRELIKNKYRVTGIDCSRAMIELAKKNSPLSKFKCRSIVDCLFETASAYIAQGEVLNYLHNKNEVIRVCKNVWNSLRPDGIFIFDVVLTSQTIPPERTVIKREKNWSICAHIKYKKDFLERRMIFSYKQGKRSFYGSEKHKQILFDRNEIIDILKRIGFKVSTYKHYGKFRLSRNHLVVIAKKIT